MTVIRQSSWHQCPVGAWSLRVDEQILKPLEADYKFCPVGPDKKELLDLNWGVVFLAQTHPSNWVMIRKALSLNLKKAFSSVCLCNWLTNSKLILIWVRTWFLVPFDWLKDADHTQPLQVQDLSSPVWNIKMWISPRSPLAVQGLVFWVSGVFL